MSHLYRSQQDRVIAGVCGGLGIYFRRDPFVFRLLFIVLAMAGGLAVPLYLLLWLAMPAASDVFTMREHSLRQAAGDDPSDTKRLDPFEPAPASAGGHRVSGDGLVLMGVLLVGLGLALLFRNTGMLALLRVLAPVALVALGIALLVDNANKPV